MPKRMRGLYRRGNVWWCSYTGLDGRVKRVSTGCKDYDQAVEFLMKAKADLKIAKEPHKKRLVNYTLADLVEPYLSWCQRQKSAVQKHRYLDQILREFGGTTLLREFNTLMLEQWQTKRLQNGINRRGVRKGPNGGRVSVELPGTARPNAPATVNRLMATLKHAFTKALEWDMITPEVAQRVRRVKLLKEPAGRERYLEPDELQRLIDCCSGTLKAMVILAAHTGMRRGEIFKLRFEWINFKRSVILLPDSKGGKPREISLNASAKEALDMVPRRIDGGRLFSNPQGKQYKTIAEQFAAACRRAGISNFHFHDLRHTFASHMVMNNVSLKAVQELLGHSTLGMTTKYLHLAPSTKADAVNILDQVLSGKATSQFTSQLG